MSDTPAEQSDDCDIICPHCGYRTKAEPCDGDAKENPSLRECDVCGKPFVLYASISITYRTIGKWEEAL
jgi:sarcosine oxidase delta subunit